MMRDCVVLMGSLQVLISLIVNRVTADVINVTTPFGVIQGHSRDINVPDGSHFNVGVFLGIPYAKAPVGPLRFQKPVKLRSPGAFYKAHEESKACPQHPIILQGWIPGPSDMSEDCLKLNVYAPSTSCVRKEMARLNDTCRKKAVLIWIHGGAFIIGQSRIYNADRLAGVGDIIVVTINYRLGPLGFLSTGDGVVPGNAGLWDQQAAIEWVNQNIAFFGGDPNRVTLSGESAGGASTLFQALYPGNVGKISRIAASSGTALSPWAFSTKTTAKFTARLAQRVGCDFRYLPGFSVERHMKEVKCLQRIPYEELLNKSIVGFVNETLFRAEWVPVVDGIFIKENPRSVFIWPAKGKNLSFQHDPSKINNSLITNMDVMIGSNYDDGEVIAKITVRNFMNLTTGIDFDDINITRELIERFYFPEIIRDFREKSPDTKEAELLSKFVQVYQKSANETVEQSISGTSAPRLKALQEVLESTTDYEFLMPAIQTISSIENLKRQDASTTSKPAPTSHLRHYFYQFNRKFPNMARPDWNREAAHGDDLPYIFGLPSSMTLAFNITDELEKREWKTSKIMMNYWANFVKSGDPNQPASISPAWSSFKLNAANYLLISENMTSASLRSNIFPQRVDLWKGLL